jgi:hypothetical protein
MDLLDLLEGSSLVRQEQYQFVPLMIFGEPSLGLLLLGLIISFFYSFLRL